MGLSGAHASGSNDPNLITNYIIYSIAGHTSCEEDSVSYSPTKGSLQHPVGIKCDSIKE